ARYLGKKPPTNPGRLRPLPHRSALHRGRPGKGIPHQRREGGRVREVRPRPIHLRRVEGTPDQSTAASLEARSTVAPRSAAVEGWRGPAAARRIGTKHWKFQETLELVIGARTGAWMLVL